MALKWSQTHGMDARLLEGGAEVACWYLVPLVSCDYCVGAIAASVAVGVI